MRELTMNEFGFVSGGNVAPPPPPPPSNQSSASRAAGFQVAHDFRADQTIYACQAPAMGDGPTEGFLDGSVVDPDNVPPSTFNTLGASTNPVVLLFSLLFHSRPAR